jgi:hypothetical protein
VDLAGSADLIIGFSTVFADKLAEFLEFLNLLVRQFPALRKAQ